MTDLVVLLAPPAPQRRSHQLPAFIPNGPWSSPPPDTDDAHPCQPVNAVLPRDRSTAWLRNAAIGLRALAAAAAAVSFTAQYRLVYAARRLALVAGLEAAIPDAAALGRHPGAVGAKTTVRSG